MKRLLFLGSVLLILGMPGQLYAQVSINADGSPPDNSAMLEVKSAEKGLLPPRMSDGNMRAIPSPANGLIVYNTSVNALWWYDGGAWRKFNDISLVETDPVFIAHPSSAISMVDIGNWNTAYGWGNHATAGYLTGFTETDPVFMVHPSSTISLSDIGNWNTAYGWGNHATAGYLTGFTETDPVFMVHPSSAISLSDIGNWNVAYGWGNHAAAGYLTGYTETDPVFTAHPASAISLVYIGNWNTAYSSRITGASGSGPLTLSVASNQVNGSVSQAGPASDGYLSSADWNLFNSNSSGQWITNGTSIYYNGGNVGIGTSTPARKLEVYGISRIRGGGYLAVDALSSGDNFGYISSAGMTTGTGLKFETARPQDAVGVVRMTISNEGNVGIGWTEPHAPIQLSNVLSNRKIVLFEDINNDHRFYGFGVNGSTLRYQVNTTSDRHVFYAGSGTSSSVELMRIQGNGTVGIGTSAPSESAALDVTATAKGFLPPRMTKAQRDAIASPAAGLIIFNTTTGIVNVFNGTIWTCLDGASADLWKCGQRITDSRDNNTYPTVPIGNQCWLAQNMNVGVRINGSQDQTNNGVIEKYCYNDLESNCGIYGGLYQWEEAKQYSMSVIGDVQGICPDGWHLPSDEEWYELTSYLNYSPGGKMKEPGTTHWLSPNSWGTNESGFTGLPGGRWYDSSGNFISITGRAISGRRTHTALRRQKAGHSYIIPLLLVG